MPTPTYISLLRAARDNRQSFYEETGRPNNESDDRIGSWLWTVFIDIRDGWRKAYAHINASLAPRSEIPGDVFETLIRTCPWDQSFWEDGILILQDGTRLFDVRVTPATAGAEGSPYRSGMPGRPTSIALVEEEFERRKRAGELAPSLTKEAEYLRDWLVKTHPAAPSMTDKTIGNRLRSDYRAASNAKTPGTTPEIKFPA
jgi:hypothetical protein